MKKRWIYFAVLLFSVFSFFTYYDTFQNLEHSLQDSLLQTNKNKKVDTRVVLVGIDEISLQHIGQWPWPRSFHGALIDMISQGNPAVVGFDIIFSEPHTNPEEDEVLVESAKNNGSTVFPSYGIFGTTIESGNMKSNELVEPFYALSQVAMTGHINTFPDKDGIVRRTALHFEYEGKRIESFAWVLYKAYMEKQNQRPKIEDMPLDSWNKMMIDFAGGSGEMEYVSYVNILTGEVPPEFFRDKIVLVGPYGMGIDDMYLTPMNHSIPMHGVEIHGNIIQNLLNGKYKKPVPFYISFIILVLLGGSGLFLFMRYSLNRMFFVLIIALGGYIFIVKLCYEKNILLPIIYPIILLVFVYVFAIAVRYVLEVLERKRVTDIFGRYVAPQVVNKILSEGQEGLKLGGSRKEITVLFVDIRGFTPLSEKAVPEEIVEILNEYLNLCAESIFAYGGTLDKFIGDAAMAIFNAPLDLVDHPLRAIQTAWKMKEGSSKLKEKIMERYGRTIEFGIGINTGVALIGNIGAQVRMDYTAIGDTVNTAARLESNAKPGQILISEATYERVKDFVKVTSLGEIHVKGKTQRVLVYQVERIV